MKILSLVVSLLLLVVNVQANANKEVQDSIVKIYTVSKIPNYSIPWNSSIRRSHGSGSIILNNRILTNAHVVANETFIEVKRHGQTKRYQAEVEFISHQSDLALLRVKDESFFDNTMPLEFGQLPQIQQKISVYGFPLGGNSLSVSTGIVSRLEHHTYAHSRENFLSIQIDAAVNPGNSGGPAISDGKIIGVVMQQITKSQNIGYIVPCVVVKHFLEDVADGLYDGFANLGVGTQKMESKTLRDVYGMQKDVSGVIVIKVSTLSSAFEVLKDGDILLSIDGHKIYNDGTVEFMPQQYTSYMYYADKKHIGESVEFELLRDFKRVEVEVRLQNIANDDLLVDTIEHDVMPRYTIYGGYVFTPLSRNLLAKIGSNRLELNEAAGKLATMEKEEEVVLLKVLADNTNRGNHNIAYWLVNNINGTEFKNFDEFKKLIANSKEKYLLLKNKDGVQIAIDNDKAKSIEKQILERYSINTNSSEK